MNWSVFTLVITMAALGIIWFYVILEVSYYVTRKLGATIGLLTALAFSVLTAATVIAIKTA